MEAGDGRGREEGWGGEAGFERKEIYNGEATFSIPPITLSLSIFFFLSFSRLSTFHLKRNFF